MSSADEISRKTFLSSTLAWAALTLSGCGSGDDDTGGTGGTGGAMGGTGGAAGIATGGSGAGTSGSAAMGGMAGGGMPVFTCQSTVEMTNGHTHALTVPGSDIAQGYQEVPYTLEDGGTGHIHTLTLSGYDMAFLQAGVSRMVASSVDADHSHVCDISCSMG